MLAIGVALLGWLTFSLATVVMTAIVLLLALLTGGLLALVKSREKPSAPDPGESERIRHL